MSIKGLAYFEDGSVEPFREKCVKFQGDLDKGLYKTTCRETKGILMLDIKSFEFKETFPPFKTKALEYLEKYTARFLAEKTRKVLKDLGYMHKMGILLEGKQGSGKTNLIKYYTNKYKDKACIFNCVDFHAFRLTNHFIQELRESQDTLFIVILDECDYPMKKNERTFKQILDGTESVENTIYFFATNYLNEIPETITKRPSRLRHVITLDGVEDIGEIKKILDDAFDKTDLTVDTEALAKQLENTTVDEIKNTIINYIMGMEKIEIRKKIGFKKLEPNHGFIITKNMKEIDEELVEDA